MYPEIDFLYLNEEDMIRAGVLDAKRCIETMKDTLSLVLKELKIIVKKMKKEFLIY